jgi:hypothetical protein
MILLGYEKDTNTYHYKWKLLTILLLLVFYFYVYKRPIGESYSYYFKNKLGMIYEAECNSTVGVLCLSNTYTKLDVDTKTFEVIREKSGFISPYAKDANYVYYEGKIIKNADPGSFGLPYWGFAKDKNTYYMDGTEIREFALKIDPNVSFNDGKAELIKFQPPLYIKMSFGDEEYTIYYTGGKNDEKRVEKIN